MLYADAGHTFLFQDWARFAARADSFLAGHPGAVGQVASASRPAR
ncbi:MAG: hypothetical protein ACRDPO_06915 [Streptosporangiaceae bacterium]